MIKELLIHKLAVNMHTRKVCQADCDFCGWNRSVPVQAGDDRTRLTREALATEIGWALVNPQISMLELMNSTISIGQEALDHYLEIAAAIHKHRGRIEFGINPGICLNQEWLRRLYESGFSYYMNNVELSPQRFTQFVRSHTQEAKLRSLHLARDVGMKTHSGLIIGYPGENGQDIMGVTKLLCEINPEWVNINFFYPLETLPLSDGFVLPSVCQVLDRIKQIRDELRGIKLCLGTGRVAWLREGLGAGLSLADGVYDRRRFLNHLPIKM